MVHQHFSLVPSFTVAENVMMGVNRVTDLPSVTTPSNRQWPIERKSCTCPSSLTRWSKCLIDLQQRVEIIKAMYRGRRRSPWTSPPHLGPTQIENLLGILSQLRDQGIRSSSSPTNSPRDGGRRPGHSAETREGRDLAGEGNSTSEPWPVP